MKKYFRQSTRRKKTVYEDESKETENPSSHAEITKTLTNAL